MLIQKYIDNKQIHPPDFLYTNISYLSLTGSRAYGTSNEKSDYDYFGFCVPPLIYLFPHKFGYINGFGPSPPEFNGFSTEPPIVDKDNGKEVDIKVFSIIKFFNLCSINNPDCLDTLFVRRENVIHTTQIGQLVRDNREKFLCQEAYFRYSGYAMSQLKKAKKEKATGKRVEGIKALGYDSKFLSHALRLLYSAEMILSEGTIELDRYKIQIKAVRDGDISLEECEKIFGDKEDYLRKLLVTTKLPKKPDYEELKKLLLTCLEIQYGDLSKYVNIPTNDTEILMKIKELVKNIG